MRPQLEINQLSAIWLCSFFFLLVFFVAQTRISLLGEVNLVHDLVDNQRSCGAKIAGFDLLSGSYQRIGVSFSATTIIIST